MSDTEKTILDYTTADNANDAFTIAIKQYEAIVEKVRAARSSGENKKIEEARALAHEKATSYSVQKMDEEITDILSHVENSVSLVTYLEEKLAQAKSVRAYADHLYRQGENTDAEEVTAEEIETMEKIKEEVIPTLLATLHLPYDGTLTMETVEPFAKKQDGKVIFAKDKKTPLLAISNKPDMAKKGGRTATTALYMWSVEGDDTEPTNDVWYFVHRVLNKNQPGMISVEGFIEAAKRNKAWGKEDVTFAVNGLTVKGERKEQK